MCVVKISVGMRNGGIWKYVSAYGCVPDAYENIQMRMDDIILSPPTHNKNWVCAKDISLYYMVLMTW